jgi:type III restriction enzyme
MVRAALASDRFSADQLSLKVSPSFDSSVFGLEAYDDFVDQVTAGREYQVEAVRTVLRYFCGGRYANAEQLARENYAASPDLQRLYATDDALVARLTFPDKLACSLDLATGTGKSFVIYAIARILLNEGLADRVLVLCPSLTIETGLTEKFVALTADGDLTDLLPVRPGGHAIPTIVDGSSTVRAGDICVENIHAAYEATGSSLRDSFAGRGERTVVISDEAHHVASVGGQAAKKWQEFIADPALGFRWHLGVSGTCYVKNEYLPDVVYRYAVRDAINDGWVKEVFYLAEDDSTTDDERFQKLLSQHEKNRKTYKPIKPLTIAVARDIRSAEALAEELTEFLSRQPGLDYASAAARVLVVTSAEKHRGNVSKLRTVDEPHDPTEWIVSVSMLTEGWDVQNVFQIYPHEKRAFDSKLLISQVLGRGLRRPLAYAGVPVVYVFNHQRWGAEIDDFVAEILDHETTISQVPVARDGVPHLVLHQLLTAPLPQTVKVTPLESNKKLDVLKLSPQMDAEEQTRFVSATDATRAAVLTTRIVERRYPVEDVVAEVRQKLLAHDKRTGGTLAGQYGKDRVREMIVSALHALGDPGLEVTQENRQRILNSYGGLRQRTAKSIARLQVEAVGLQDVSSDGMRVVRARVATLTRDVGLFHDEESSKLSSDEDRRALVKADSLPDPKNVREVGNSFDFKSPTNVVLTDHQPERRFAERLFGSKTAQAVRSWVKAPDTGFYEIEYSFQEGGVGRSKRGTFNPDFFIWLKDMDVVVVAEVKADGDDSWRNHGKVASAEAHFAEVNKMLTERGDSRRYVFTMVTPKDFDKFFEALRAGVPESFTSSLQGVLASKPSSDPLTTL